MNTLRVLLITPGLTPKFGGSAFSESALASHLKSKCSLTVLCREGNTDEKFLSAAGLSEVKTYRPVEVLKAYFDSSHEISKQILASDILHINGHWRWENSFFAAIAERKNIPYVFHPRGMLVMNYRKIFLKRVFNWVMGNFLIKHAARIIALSQFEIGQFKLHPITEKQIAVIPNGITPPSSMPSYRLNFPEKYFLYFGRIEARKNLLFLVNAFAKYVAQGGKSNLC